MEKIITKCKVEDVQKAQNLDEPEAAGGETFFEKIDLSKFRSAFVSIKINEDIRNTMEEARLNKQRLELQREMEKNMKKADKPKAKKVKKIGGLTLEEMHEKMRKEKLEKKKAKARHLKRAFASIDKS